LGSPEVQGIDEFSKAVGIVRHAKRLEWIRRPAAAWSVPCYERECVGQSVDHALPFPAVADKSVQEEDQWAFAFPPIRHAESADLKLVHAIHYFGSGMAVRIMLPVIGSDTDGRARPSVRTGRPLAEPDNGDVAIGLGPILHVLRCVDGDASPRGLQLLSFESLCPDIATTTVIESMTASDCFARLCSQAGCLLAPAMDAITSHDSGDSSR
jgi:hypothetical protein